MGTRFPSSRTQPQTHTDTERIPLTAISAAICTHARARRPLDPQPGELVQAWRQRGRWYFGERVFVEDGLIKTEYPLRRGWFPKACVEDEEDMDHPFDYRGDGKWLRPMPVDNDDDGGDGDDGDGNKQRSGNGTAEAESKKEQ